MWIKQSNGKTAPAIVLKTDKDLDLSLLFTSLQGVPVKLAKDAHKGQTCFTLGNPLGIVNTVSLRYYFKCTENKRTSSNIFLYRRCCSPWK